MSSWLASSSPDAAVEIAQERISAAVVSLRAGQPVVTAHASEVVPAGAITPSLTAGNIHDTAGVSAILQRVFDRLGARPKRVALVIPDSAVKISLIRFERAPARRDDLDQLVRWQVRKSTPFPIDEAVVSYTSGIQAGESGREYLVTLARKEAIAEYEAVCSSAGAHAGLVEPASTSLLNMFLSSTVPDGDWLLVYVRPDSTSIAIMRGENLIFYRNRAEGEADSLGDLVHQTTMYYQDRLAGTGFSKVLVGGSTWSAGTVETARRSLEEHLGVAVEPVDPTRFAALTDRITVTPDMMDALGPVVGVSLRCLRVGVTA